MNRGTPMKDSAIQQGIRPQEKATSRSSASQLTASYRHGSEAFREEHGFQVAYSGTVDPANVGKVRPEETRDLVLQSSPIRRSKLHELVSQKLEDMIRSGELKPGDRLPSERDIMAAYGIGRPAVREAFLSLQSKGFISTESGRRARVVAPSLDNVFTTLDSVVGMIISKRESLKNLFDARQFIEAAMARQAAVVIDKVHLAQLTQALEANRQAIGDRTLFMQTDIEFHHILFSVSNNQVFDTIHTAVVNWLMERWAKIERTEATEKLAYKGHLEIANAVETGDPDAAEKAMNKHLSSSWSVWAQQLTRS
jgi:DNA-binding FadR family transcriptional regulator